MKHAFQTTARPASSLRPWALSCGMALALGSMANASPVPGSAPAAKPSAATQAPAAPASAVDPDAPIGPSRYVGSENLGTYIQSLSTVFSMRTRPIDPFGQLQDPDAKPIAKPTVAKARRRTAPLKATPFAEIIDRIQVTTIMPGERSFLIGTRSFKQGDRFPMNFRGRSIEVEISAVNSREIEFRSIADDETASLKLNLLPVGMTPGNGEITAPGMVPDRPDSPLEVEPGDFSNTTSQN